MSVKIASQPVPVGFGRGRRTNRIAILQTCTSKWKQIPRRIHQWAPDDLPDFWTRSAVHGLITGSEETGFDLIWRYWMKDESPEAIAASLLPHGADALVLLAPRDEHVSLVPVLEQMEVPFVLAYARRTEPHIPWSACDNAGGVAQAVGHFANLGHTRIGFVSGPPDVADFVERRQGYLDGLEKAGLDLDPSLIEETGHRVTTRDMRPLVTRLLRRSDPPTALICCTDVLAFSVVEIAWEMGMSVPQDIAVIGFDDSEEATQTVPPLTTIRQPVPVVSSLACYLAACAVVGQEPETGSWQVDLPVSFIVRESCGAVLRANAGAERTPGPRADTHVIRREMERQTRQLVAMNEEMEELLYVASHDLRSPLVTIQGFTSALERKYTQSLDQRGKDYLRRIRHSVDSMGELIDTLLTLSRTQSQPLNLQLIPARQIVARVLQDLEGPIKERKVNVRLPHLMPTVLADEIALYQIFMNLIGNALKFVGDQPYPSIFISYRSRLDEHEFSVRDNGVGISPEHHHEIFQAFRRLDDMPSDGSGIGLTIVKRMVLRHGGRIWVESEKGAGATFRFTLPRRESQS